MTKKFYQKSIPERHEILAQQAGLNAKQLEAYSSEGGLRIETANAMIENVVGLYSLPVGIGRNFLVNGRDVLIPMVTEEPSVVASVSYMAKLARPSGGFTAGMT
ncbi:MAG: 3-hydroxy-3-methylglutaryl-CoA reductase, partial [Chloroflexi bacterium]|nr:3-hydroxy-3-methylglutaryl-CoA reductase [Chloroflexota bacterium]